MSRPAVRLVGPWALPEVTVRQLPSSRVLDEAVERLVERTWAAQGDEAARLGMRLSDAAAYRLEDATTGPGGLVLSLAEVPYRVHSAMKAVHGDPRVRPEHRDRALVVDGLVRTADDAVVLLRTPKVTGPELQLVGGTAGPGRRRIERPDDLAAFLADVVTRALGVPAAAVAVGPVLGLVDHVVGCVNVVVEVRLDRTADDVRPSGRSEVVRVPAADLVETLASGPAYLPAVADLLRAPLVEQ